METVLDLDNGNTAAACSLVFMDYR
jgi:hypothetical protein